MKVRFYGSCDVYENFAWMNEVEYKKVFDKEYEANNIQTCVYEFFKEIFDTELEIYQIDRFLKDLKAIKRNKTSLTSIEPRFGKFKYCNIFDYGTGGGDDIEYNFLMNVEVVFEEDEVKVPLFKEQFLRLNEAVQKDNALFISDKGTIAVFDEVKTSDDNYINMLCIINNSFVSTIKVKEFYLNFYKDIKDIKDITSIIVVDNDDIEREFFIKWLSNKKVKDKSFVEKFRL